MTEIWKDISGYAGLYQVSNKGRVRSVDRLVKYTLKGNERVRRCKGKLISQHDASGYKFVELNDHAKKTYLVHRLVALAFLPNPHNKETVNHIDGDKYNNCVDNLEWATSSENIKHSFLLGLRDTDNVRNARNKAAMSNAVKIRCIETGQVFDSINSACSHFHFPASSIYFGDKQIIRKHEYHFERVVV